MNFYEGKHEARAEKRSSFVSLATAALALHTTARAATAPPHVSLVTHSDRRARGVGVLGRARLFADRRALVDESLHAARRRSSAASAVFSAVFGGRGRRARPRGARVEPLPVPVLGPAGRDHRPAVVRRRRGRRQLARHPQPDALRPPRRA